jgi:hypothetical protein
MAAAAARIDGSMRSISSRRLPGSSPTTVSPAPTPRAARALAVGRAAEVVEKRMPDELHGDAGRAVQRRLEGEHGQHE